MIELKDINVDFKIKGNIIHAVKNVNLKINKGEVFGIVGLSGAGKSTLVRVINLLQKPSSGQVIIDGIDITKLSRYSLRKTRLKIGMIFQHFNLISGKTVYENIEFVLKANDYPKEKRKSRINELLSLVNLSEKADVYPSSLSGGQKQRVAIARALALNPKVLLCDEATSALDPNTTKSILSLLQDINKKLDITIIIVTHQMEVIKQICSRVAIMENGQVLEIGETEELFLQNSKNLQKLVGEEDIVLPKGTNIRIIFPKEISNDTIITSMARDLDINFSIICGKLEKYRDDILGSLIINVSNNHRENIKKYLDEKNVRWEEIINE